MLRIIIEDIETFNEKTQEFEVIDGAVLDLEHSLFSLSKWESKHQKSFLSSTDLSAEEVLSYIQEMVITPNADLDALLRCSPETIDKIHKYIDSSQSATTFGVMPERRGPTEKITSELIYYWMVSYNIPFECERWHLNRLFSLIRICGIKSSKPKKMSRNEIAQRNREINEKRRKELGTTG